MTRSPAEPPASDADFRSMTVGDYLAFYERRGYGFEIGRGQRPAVLVIDFSIAFTRGTPNFPGGGYDRQVAETTRLLDAARGRAPIYFTTIAYEPHMRDAGLWAAKIPWIKSLQLSSVESAIDERLAVRPDEPVIVKKFPSAFFETGLEALLAKDRIDTLIIAGCTTSACVRATTVDAMQRGYRPLLAAECIGDITPALHAVHLADLRSRYADVVAVDELVAYLRGLDKS